VLLGLETRRPRGVFAEAEEAPQLVAEPGERSVFGGGHTADRHPEIHIVSRC